MAKYSHCLDLHFSPANVNLMINKSKAGRQSQGGAERISFENV